MRHPLPLLLLLLLSSPFLNAQVRLPSLLSPGMVLQRDTVVKIWGWASPGERVEVEAGWLVEKAVAITGAEGKWITAIPTGPAGGPHSIIITGKNRIVLNDILFGEVWLCSGQSNMEFTIKMLGGWKQYRDEKRDIRVHDYSAIRLCQVARSPDSLPSDSCRATWRPATVETVAGFSATAFFFGRTLYNLLKVPIGLISTTVGGTPAEAWTARECLQPEQNLNWFLKSPNSDGWECSKASWLYNGMIHPLINYRIKGAIWYQGESNRYQADLYDQLIATMVKCWRGRWEQGDFPFYFVQIAPFKYMEDFFPAAAYLREAQQRTLSVPRSGMAVTMDMGDIRDIHPKNKQDVGLRLALLALHDTYGMKEKACSGPIFNGWKAEGSDALIGFDHADEGLMVKGDRLRSFTMAGSDGVFHEADARIEGNRVRLRSPRVPDPVHIRFAFADTAAVNLFNLAGLPAAPFRTDSIPLIIRDVKVKLKPGQQGHNPALTLTCDDTSCLIRYTVNSPDTTRPRGIPAARAMEKISMSRDAPDPSSILYRTPIPLDSSVTILARAFKGAIPSPLLAIVTFYHHRAIGKKITTKDPFSPRYPGGPKVLLDGIRGSVDFRDGLWQGYEGVGFEGTIDLGAPATISKVSIGFLHDARSWIFLPESMTIAVSADGKTFTVVKEIITTDSPKLREPFVKEYLWDALTGRDQNAGKQDEAGNREVSGSPKPESMTARYIRIVAKNRGVCPNWHPGKGHHAWLFADEAVVE